MWILQLVPPHKWQASHFQRHIWFHIIYAQPDFPFHSLLRCLHFNLESFLWSFSIHLSITTASQISQDLCWRGCFWRINSFNHSTFSCQLSCILMLMNTRHIQINVRCAFIIRYIRVPSTPTPWLSCHSSSQWWRLSSQSLIVCYPLPQSHILPCHSPHSGSRQKTGEARKITPHYFGVAWNLSWMVPSGLELARS